MGKLDIGVKTMSKENKSYIYHKGSLEEEWKKEALKNRKEIERLNKIIDELEIELLTDIAIYSDDVQRAYEIIYDKLKELKQEN